MFPPRSNHNSFFSAIRAAISGFGIPLFLIGCASVVPTAPPPKGSLSLSATSFNFNTVVVGKTSSTQTLSVTNSGAAPFTLEALTVKSRQFQITGPAVPRTILAGQTVSYTLLFAPTSSGNETTSLQITTDISTAPVGVSLAGVGEAESKAPSPKGSLSLSATSFNFNTVVVGKTSSTQTLRVTNSGDAPVTLETLTLKSQQFQITGPAVPRTILAGQTVSYTLLFAPTSSGNETTLLQITTDISTAPVGVSLAGVGEKAFATVEVTPASVNFGSLKLQTSGAKTITLKNTGDIKMTVSGITVAGAGFGYSDLSPGLSLAPNQTVTFRVWFKPTTAGSASGSVTILSSNIASPEDISVSGEGLSSSSPPPPPPVQHAVSLSWQPSTSNVTGYRVYRSTTSGANFSPLTSTINDLSYTDSTVAGGTTYYYVVTAVDTDGNESSYSAQVAAVIPAS